MKAAILIKELLQGRVLQVILKKFLPPVVSNTNFSFSKFAEKYWWGTTNTSNKCIRASRSKSVRAEIANLDFRLLQFLCSK